MTVLHFHITVLHFVIFNWYDTNHTAVWYNFTTALQHHIAMISFHTTVLHFHTGVWRAKQAGGVQNGRMMCKTGGWCSKRAYDVRNGGMWNEYQPN